MSLTWKQIQAEYASALSAIPTIDASMLDPEFTHTVQRVLQKLSTWANLNANIELTMKMRNREVDGNALVGVYRTAQAIDLASFYKQVGVMAGWVAKRTTSRYCAITHNLLSTGLTFQSVPKSPEWVLSLMWDSLPRKPYCLANQDDSAAIAGALQHGVRTFLHVDDAGYSGNQKKYVFRTVERQATAEKVVVTCLLAVPFQTRTARRLWAKKFQDTEYVRYKVCDKSPYVREIIDLEGKVPEDVLRVIQGRSLTLFQHKMPDWASFPQPLASYLRNRVGGYSSMPPYKHASKWSSAIPKNPRRPEVLI